MEHLPGRNGVVGGSFRSPRTLAFCSSLTPAAPSSLLQSPVTYKFRRLRSHAPSLPLPVSHQSFGPAPRFRPRGVSVPGSLPRFLAPAGLPGRAGRAQHQSGLGAPGTTLAAPPPCAIPGPPRPPARAAHGVPVRLLDVLPGRAAAAARGAGGGPGPVPGAAPAQPPLPRGDGSLPAGAALPGRCGVRRRGRPRLGLPRGLGGTGDRPGRPGFGQRRRRGARGRWLGRPGSRAPGGRGPWRWGVVSRLQPPPHPRPGPCYLRGSDHGEEPRAPRHRAEGRFAGLPRPEGRGTLAGSWRPMTDEERGGRERRTVDLKGDAGAAGGLDSLYLQPLWQPSCLWRNQLCPQMRSSSHSPFHWIDCPQGHLKPR